MKYIFRFRFRPKIAGLFRFRLFFGRKRKFMFRLFLFYGRKSKIHFRSASSSIPPQQIEVVGFGPKTAPSTTHSIRRRKSSSAAVMSRIDLSACHWLPAGHRTALIDALQLTLRCSFTPRRLKDTEHTWGFFLENSQGNEIELGLQKLSSTYHAYPTHTRFLKWIALFDVTWYALCIFLTFLRSTFT